MYSSIKIKSFFLSMLLITLISCSMKNRTLPGDEETRRLIRNTIHNYSSDDWEERLNAVKSSSKYSGSFYSKDILLLMLLAADDYHPLVQIEAIKNLRQMRSNAALEKLRELSLSNSNLNVIRASITALSDYSLPENADIFIEGIEDSDWLIREASYLGLLKIVPDEVQRQYVGTILKGINDKNLSVKIAVLNNVKIKDPLLYSSISGLIRNRKTGISLLKGALVAIKGYTFDDETRKRLLDLLTHRNKEIRILSLQALKREKIELNF